MEKEEFYNFLENPDLLNDQTAQRLKQMVKEYPFFQLGGMLYLKNLKMINAVEFDEELKKIAVKVYDRKKLFRFLSPEKREQPEKNSFEYKESAPLYKIDGGNEPERGNSLIDKFLSSSKILGSEDKTEQKKNSLQEFEDEVLKKSVEENDEIVTETLAMIYFQQKNYEKALDSFRKLSLKYPEKSVYFATRIEEIEKLKNI